jgi:hypothetical protein
VKLASAMIRLAPLSLLSAVGALALGCAKPPAPPPPEEKWTLVASETAPIFGELEDDEDAPEVLRKGELVKIVHEIRAAHWSAKMEGVPSSRVGMALEVKYADDGVVVYAYQPDFGAEVSVPVTSSLCEAIAAQGTFDMSRCSGSLRRAKTPDGALALYMACVSGPCPVGLLRDGKLAVIAVENLSSARFFSGKNKSVLVAATRWVKSAGQQSGGALVTIALDGAGPVRKDEIATDEIDARDPQKVLSRMVDARVTASEIAVDGEETVRATDGSVLSTTPIHQKLALPSLD